MPEINSHWPTPLAVKIRRYMTLGTFTYTWHHLPSGAKGERTLEDMDRIGALEQINTWHGVNSEYRYYLKP